MLAGYPPQGAAATP